MTPLSNNSAPSTVAWSLCEYTRCRAVVSCSIHGDTVTPCGRHSYDCYNFPDGTECAELELIGESGGAAAGVKGRARGGIARGLTLPVAVCPQLRPS